MILEESRMNSLTLESKYEITETCIRNTAWVEVYQKFFRVLTNSWLVVGEWEETHGGVRGRERSAWQGGEERVCELWEREGEEARGEKRWKGRKRKEKKSKGKKKVGLGFRVHIIFICFSWNKLKLFLPKIASLKRKQSWGNLFVNLNLVDLNFYIIGLSAH